jgi:hypothetical protein
MAQEQQAQLQQQIEEFRAQHPELIEAMRVFGVSAEQYARAMVALTRHPTVTSTSTDLSAQQ